MAELTAETIYGFTTSVLLSRFDNPQPTPTFHKEMWGLVTSPRKYVAIAAPRGHAKSTAITHSYVLASVLFRKRSFVLLVSDTEGQAVQFLGDIKKELYENEALIQLFGVVKLVKDTESDIIVKLNDGHEFRIIAKGSEQKVRGIKWRNKRPDLIIGDDLENDEIVLNEERREKFRKWFFQALLPAGSDNCLVRIVGTILHLDSLLERLMPVNNDELTVHTPLKTYSKNPKNTWLSVKYRAHPALNDFSYLLWPEKWTEARLRMERDNYLEQGDPEGYAQEYLNNPIDDTNSFFRKSDFLDIEDSSAPTDYYSAGDLAISEKERRAYTVLATAGVIANGDLIVEDIRRFRGDGYEIINELFSVDTRYKPQLFVLEQENIARSLGSFLYKEMEERQQYINIEPVVVTQDKMKRARSLQARMRAGKVRFKKDAEWFPALQEEMLQFPKGRYADQVDALAHICLILDKMADVPTAEEYADELYEDEYDSTYLFTASGRNRVTGY